MPATTRLIVAPHGGLPHQPFEPGSRQGFTTHFDNAMVDHVLPAVGPVAWKVLTVIIRYTRGYHRDDVTLTVTELEQLTGLQKSAVIRALKTLTSSLPGISAEGTGGVVTRHRASVKAPTSYLLNRTFALIDARPRRLASRSEVPP